MHSDVGYTNHPSLHTVLWAIVDKDGRIIVEFQMKMKSRKRNGKVAYVKWSYDGTTCRRTFRPQHKRGNGNRVRYRSRRNAGGPSHATVACKGVLGTKDASPIDQAEDVQSLDLQPLSKSPKPSGPDTDPVAGVHKIEGIIQNAQIRKSLQEQRNALFCTERPRPKKYKIPIQATCKTTNPVEDYRFIRQGKDAVKYGGSLF